MEEEKKRTNYPRKIARIFLRVILFLVLFVILVFILVLTPPVQRFLTGKVENYLQNKLKTRVEIGSISFGLTGKLNLENIYVEDTKKDTLLAGGAIRTHINFLKLFSNEVQIKDIELQNITAKIKRVLPDTVFNYQFIVDAFTTQAMEDTTESAPMKFNISDLALENVRLTFTDAITGNDLFARIGNLSVTIDTLDPYTANLDIPSIIGRNISATFNQSKPLIIPDPPGKDVAEAAAPVPLRLNLGTIDLSKLNLQFDNHVSAFHAKLNVGQIKAVSKLIDLQTNTIHLDQVVLNRSRSVIRVGNKETGEMIKKEVVQEVAAQKPKGWNFRVDQLSLDRNHFQYDDMNEPAARYGMDYSHINASDLSLKVEDLVFQTDTISGNISSGSMKEKSGFFLQELRTAFLYAPDQAYLKDLYIKTPGTELRRSLVLEYASPEALAKNFAQTVFNIELVNSRVQVRDILVFAPQLRSNPALADPNDIWNLNIVGSGTAERLHFESLQFAGLSNTQIDAYGTLSGLTNPSMAGGNFVIRKFNTSQTDIALFTGQRLSNAQMNLPETFNISGTIQGTQGRFVADLDMNSSAGFLGLNGSFGNLTNPSATVYNAKIYTNNLKLGSILRRPDEIGNLSGSITVKGSGLTPEAINASFDGALSSLGYNNYQYRDVRLKGNLKGTVFSVDANIDDPNADLNLTASGNFGNNPTFRIDGMIDSVKTMPLNFSTKPVVFRGQVNGTVANINPDYLDADVLLTRVLLVSEDERLALDTVQLTSGRNDTANYIRLSSDIANAEIIGQYRFTDLGSIVQTSIQPYFSVAPPTTVSQVRPYDFRFSADIRYAPIFSSFVPTLTSMETLHAEGTFVMNEGMRASLTTPQLSFGGNQMSNLVVKAHTSDSGLVVNATAGHLKSGNSFDLYNARLNATALNNVIDFSLGIDDINANNKYYFSGVLNQPSRGTYALRLHPDSLLLNYETWSVPPDNLLTISPSSITANNFVLQKNGQKLSIENIAGPGKNPLRLTFTDFRLGTITGFIKSDSLLADGVMNGNVVFHNILEQPVFTTDLNINDLSMKQDTIGNLNIRVNNTAGNRYQTNLTLSGRGNDVTMTGFLTPQGKNLLMELDLAVKQLQLNTLEGALAQLMTNASGAINGNVKIRGSTAAPSIQGNLNFDKASFALTALGSQFTIDNEKLSVNENGFVFDSFTLRDSANNALTINGTVATTNLVNYDFNLRVNARNFMVLNSEKTQDKIYYGRLNITSNLNITGTEEKPVVDGSLTVNEGTDLSVIVPQPEPGIQQREGIVQFVDMDAPENDTLFLAYDSLNKSSILGMDIAVNIEVTKEAILNVVIDEANGDFLHVRGEAQLTTGIDPSGKITLVGNYTLEDGAYRISFNFLQRKFDIEQGSTITWTGEPTTALLNVTAVYIANTAPLDLVADQISAPTPAIRNTYLQKLPFEVHLHLTGELMKPVIDFDILLPADKNYGVSNDIVTAVQARLEQLKQDEGEINKQVFSLLLLGRFVGQNPFESSGDAFDFGTYARQSVSKLLTEQLNQLAAGLVSGIDIDFDVASTEDYTTGSRQNRTDLNVGLSKRLLNDRLKITVGSNFQLEGPQNSNQENNNIAGNVAVDYQLTKDGRFLLRFFRRNQYEGIVDGYIIENGLSFILSVDYNRFREILRGKRQRVTRDGTIQNAARR